MTVRLDSSLWRRFGASSVAAIFILAGCVTSPTISRTVYEDPIVLVQLDSSSPLKDAAGEPDQQVAKFTTAHLTSVLQSIMIQRETSFVSYWVLRSMPQPEPAFPNDDAQLLAPHLLAALLKARGDETAVFVLRRTREDGIPLVTTGGMLIRGDQLIVLLANVRRPAITLRKLEISKEVPLQPIGEMEFHFVPGRYQTTLARNDLSSTLVTSSVQTLSLDYKAWLTEPSRASSPTQAQPDIPGSLAEEKLHHLKIWHEQGLITDDEYLEKRREILKRF
mgnify:CR=1 FL=1